MGWVFVPSSVLAQLDTLGQNHFQLNLLEQDLVHQQSDCVGIVQTEKKSNLVEQDLVHQQSDCVGIVQTENKSNLVEQAELDETQLLEPLPTLSFLELTKIKSINDNQYSQSKEVGPALITLTEIGSTPISNQSSSYRLYSESRLPQSITENNIAKSIIRNNTPRDPNRIYRKRFFWGIAFSGTQAKMKMQLDPVFWQRNDSLINIRPQGQLGGGFGGSVAMRIMRQWELKMLTMLQLHNRNIDFDWKYTPTQTLKIETISLDIPLTLKYRSDMPNNTGFFVVGGVRWSHDFQSMEGTVIGASKPLVAIKEDTYYYEFGCGFEFRMEYVDMSIELKMSNGLNNALVRVPESYYSGSMSAIFPRLFSITLMAQN